MARKKLEYEGRDLEAMDFALKYHQWILGIFRPYLGKIIVEVGAGSGSFTELLILESPQKVIAIEPSEEMYPLLEKTLNKQTTTKTKAHKAFFKEVATSIKKEKPSSIIYINVFEHIEDDTQELKSLYDTMSSGAKLCIFVPANPWLLSNFDRKIGHFRRYTKKELADKVQAAGFNVKLLRRFDAIGILPWAIKFRLLKSEDMEPGLAKLYDSTVVPVERFIEKKVPPLVGKNLILVVEKP